MFFSDMDIFAFWVKTFILVFNFVFFYYNQYHAYFKVYTFYYLQFQEYFLSKASYLSSNWCTLENSGRVMEQGGHCGLYWSVTYDHGSSGCWVNRSLAWSHQISENSLSHSILIFPFLDLSQQGSAGAYENWEWSWEANQTISNLKCLG